MPVRAVPDQDLTDVAAADRAIVQSAGGRALREKIAMLIRPHRLLFPLLRQKSIPSYVGDALDQVLIAIDRWEREERA